MTRRDHAVDVAHVAEMLAATAGLDFSGGRGRWLRHFLSMARTKDLDWARMVAGEDPDTFALLCDAATVQESYFFRESATLEFLRQRVIPELRARPGPIRTWSAGCAAGEEAYTLGMMLFDAGLADRAHVLGTDIAPSAVRAARTASYGRWSMRGVDEQTVRARFQREGTAFKVVSERCAAVVFERHNLLSPSPPLGGPFQLVLCRNVLIYLTPAALQRVCTLLVESLAPGGWLVTGVSDPSLREMAGLEPVAGSRGTVYRRVESSLRTCGASPAPRAPETEAGPPMIVTEPSARRDPATRREVGHSREPRTARTATVASVGRPIRPTAHWQARAERALLEAEPHECERLARAVLKVDVHSAVAHSLLVRALAAEGRHGDAMSAADIAVRAVGEDSELRSLHAALLLDEDRFEEAQVAARQGVFLDPDNALAYLVLARASTLLGDPGTAERASRIGKRILERKASRR